MERIVSDTLKEFRAFLMRGNLIQLAVAFVVGVAFAAVISSFVKNLVMPTFAAIAAAVFFFIVKPVDMVTKRRGTQEPDGEVISDEERRHQELLEALRAG